MRGKKQKIRKWSNCRRKLSFSDIAVFVLFLCSASLFHLYERIFGLPVIEETSTHGVELRITFIGRFFF